MTGTHCCGLTGILWVLPLLPILTTDHVRFICRACPVLLGLLASPGPVASPVLSVLLELLVPEDLL